MPELSALRTSELLQLHADIASELRKRDVIRSANNPTGDYAERLFSLAFGWTLVSNSNAAYDAVDRDGLRYQIKCRRMTRSESKSRQLGTLRRLPEASFDVLAVALLRENYEVERAMLMPHANIEPISKFSAHVNGWIFRLQDSHWELDGVVDVTDKLRLTALSLF
jgi:hypothetical protein